jgi:hypothetical protein
MPIIPQVNRNSSFMSSWLLMTLIHTCAVTGSALTLLSIGFSGSPYPRKVAIERSGSSWRSRPQWIV